MSRRSIPTPEQLRRRDVRALREELHRAESMLSDLIREFSWAHSYGFSPHVSGEPSTSGGDHSDPTFGTTTSPNKNGARTALKIATERVRSARANAERAAKDVAVAIAVLRKALVGGARGRLVMPDHAAPAVGRVSKRELAELHEAKERRQERGEDYGDG